MTNTVVQTAGEPYKDQRAVVCKGLGEQSTIPTSGALNPKQKGKPKIKVLQAHAGADIKKHLSLAREEVCMLNEVGQNLLNPALTGGYKWSPSQGNTAARTS